VAWLPAWNVRLGRAQAVEDLPRFGEWNSDSVNSSTYVTINKRQMIPEVRFLPAFFAGGMSGRE